MSNAEKIRELYRDNPHISRDEVAEKLGTSKAVIKASISRDVKQGKAVYIENNGVDYSHYFNTNTAKKALMDSKNEIRWEMVELLLAAMRKETDGDKLSKLSDKVDRLLKEITE
ncbi:hypothetical protein E5983_00700 [Streptococcus danieliae]|uniref:Phage protein n=1 Tax=Streptococcus danieliae TaxID=747656 RepID=A0A7X3KC34_9STRE|nr:hypothetical protein [Streptococcus danieliae]MVX58193.1 hypothetical protein [Streptococcus danieliae]